MHTQDGLHLLSEPYISWVKLFSVTAPLNPKLYVSYNARTQETTVVTTELNPLHLSMIQRLMALSGTSIPPEETAQLLIQCFTVMQEGFEAGAAHLDAQAAGSVCCSILLFTLASCAYPPSQEEMQAQLLGKTADHEDRVRRAEIRATVADELRGHVKVFQSALISLETYFQGFWDTMNLDPNTRESLCALITEQRNHCEVTSHLVDNIVTRSDRFLNLVWCLYPHSNQC